MHEETLGELIKRVRKLAKLSQEELARSVGVSQQALGKWESDESLPRPKALSRLAVCLGVPTEDLYQAKLTTLSKMVPKKASAESPQLQPPSPSESQSTCFAGLGLLGRLAQALENKQLHGDQIAVLGSVLDSFVRTPLGGRKLASASIPGGQQG